MCWCSDEAKEKDRDLLKRELTRIVSCMTEAAGCQQPSKDTHHGVNQELEMYLSNECKQLSTLNKFPLAKELFLKFNTGIPSSAPVERLS